MENNTVPEQAIRNLFKRGFLIGLIASLIVSAVAGIIVFLVGNFGDFEIKILFTTLVIGIFSLTGLINAALLDKTQLLKIFGYYSLLISLFAALLLILTIWSDNFNQIQMATDFTIAALSSAHISLLLAIKLKSQFISYVRTSTIIFIIIVAGLIIYLINTSFFDDTSPFYFRLLGIFAILDALGTITMPILNKIKKNN